jgi:hypothetical protein
LGIKQENGVTMDVTNENTGMIEKLGTIKQYSSMLRDKHFAIEFEDFASTNPGRTPVEQCNYSASQHHD